MEDIIAKESKEQLEVLNKTIQERNTVKMSEFKDYIGLFNKDYVESLNAEERYTLGKKFAMRFSRRDPIVVVNDNDPNDTYTIPAQFCTVPLLNSNPKATDTLERLEYALSLKNNIVDRVSPLVKELMEEITSIGGAETLHKENQAYKDAIENLKSKKEPVPTIAIAKEIDPIKTGPVSMKDLL